MSNEDQDLSDRLPPYAVTTWRVLHDLEASIAAAAGGGAHRADPAWHDAAASVGAGQLAIASTFPDVLTAPPPTASVQPLADLAAQLERATRQAPGHDEAWAGVEASQVDVVAAVHRLVDQG